MAKPPTFTNDEYRRINALAGHDAARRRFRAEAQVVEERPGERTPDELNAIACRRAWADRIDARDGPDVPYVPSRQRWWEAEFLKGAVTFGAICSVFGPVPLMFLWPFADDDYQGRMTRVLQMPVGLFMAAAVWIVILFAFSVL